MKVSVIVPIYNCADYLPKCIESILAQTHTDLELILVDDGSSDDSGSVRDIYSERDNTTVTAPVSAGDVLGEITLMKDGAAYGTVPLVAAVDVALSRGAFLRTGLHSFFAHPIVIAILVVAIIVILLYIMMLVRYHKRQKARKRAAARARREAAANREHQARDEILRELTQDNGSRRR